MKKIFEVNFHLDELNRFTQNRKFCPFVCELDKRFENYCSILTRGEWIDHWDDRVIFISCQDGELLDRLSNDSGMYLLSDKVISVFKENNVKGFQFLPVSILTHDKSKLPGYNCVGNIYKTVSCLNLEKSVYSVFGDKDSKYPHPNPAYWGRVRVLDKMMINQSMLPTDLDIFRLAEKETRVLVSEKFVDVWRSYKFSNLHFLEIQTV
jgi:hypothetical protein